ncbi:prenyltransferase [Candidatus Nitrosotalea okcheonensis]|uniref:UbiA prenyltransferase n=1 Tax=Candidatus Nitrosotalea okcheonensis TaxID=1903276 RepID=A0A2H1FE43_9ARCH|nr:prenyltransferase [Candidatus Nitrosotalea okcheonensis]SMH71025.1 UbiA prenyltransferase [Candidatus Nitrosotalea okcheonensis]
MLKVWLRAVRIRFLLASIISVCLGLAINSWQNKTIDIGFAVLTFVGVTALHASVDLLNDYWDYKRQIDTDTKRTKFSGGTGVLPEGLLKPEQVYRAGVLMLVLGSAVGAFFIFERGITIAVILGFAIVSIYFYSTRIVDSGLGEVFVAIKGCMIVLGTYFVQSSHITIEPVIAGIISGILSSTVLFVNSFPDFDADKKHGRKTLVIILGKQKAATVIWIFPIIIYGIILVSTISGIFPFITLITLATIPMAIRSGKSLIKNYENVDELVPVMQGFVTYSRITGALFVISFLIGILLKIPQ